MQNKLISYFRFLLSDQTVIITEHAELHLTIKYLRHIFWYRNLVILVLQLLYSIIVSYILLNTGVANSTEFLSSEFNVILFALFYWFKWVKTSCIQLWSGKFLNNNNSMICKEYGFWTRVYSQWCITNRFVKEQRTK